MHWFKTVSAQQSIHSPTASDNWKWRSYFLILNNLYLFMKGRVQQNYNNYLLISRYTWLPCSSYFSFRFFSLWVFQWRQVLSFLPVLSGGFEGIFNIPLFLEVVSVLQHLRMRPSLLLEKSRRTCCLPRPNASSPSFAKERFICLLKITSASSHSLPRFLRDRGLQISFFACFYLFCFLCCPWYFG